MRLNLRAELVNENRGIVTLDVPDLKEIHLVTGAKMLMENGEHRDLADDEVRDLEDCLEEFYLKRIGRALAKIVSLEG